MSIGKNKDFRDQERLEAKANTNTNTIQIIADIRVVITAQIDSDKDVYVLDGNDDQATKILLEAYPHSKNCIVMISYLYVTILLEWGYWNEERKYKIIGLNSSGLNIQCKTSSGYD